MVVVASDLEYRLSGGASNVDPNASLGGAMSSNDISSAVIENLFDNVTASEATTGTVEYRCLYILNTNTTDTLEDVNIWIQAQTPSADTSIEIGLDPAGIGDGSTTGVATTIVDETTAPAGVTFSAPSDIASALTVGNLDASDAQAIWIKRTVAVGAASSPLDNFVLRFRGVAV